MPFVRGLLRDEAGATAIEYALIASLIALAIVVGLTDVGQKLNAAFGKVANGFP